MVNQVADRDYPILMDTKDGRVHLRVPDLPGCAASGETIEEALSAIEEAKRTWVDMALAMGKKVPDPSSPDLYPHRSKWKLSVEIIRAPSVISDR